jgi:hypothetical protein
VPFHEPARDVLPFAATAPSPQSTTSAASVRRGVVVGCARRIVREVVAMEVLRRPELAGAFVV